MAVFDPDAQRICVRVVYDGSAGTGKTTNLRQLSTLFAGQRSAELTSPAELRGRTLYFDWMDISAGAACGFPLMCQVISVPGQVAFTERRRYLLASADVVVYVCDSTKDGASRAREALGVLDEIGRSCDTPAKLLLQANKQDQPDSIGGKELLQLVGRPELPVVEAIATEGVGVVDTFVSAVRTVARDLTVRMEREGLRLPVRSATGMNRVLTHIARTPIDPFGAAELLLEEASAALLFDGPESLIAKTEPQGAPPSLAATLPNADVPTGFIWPAHTGRATLRKLAREGALDKSVAVDEGDAMQVIQDHILSTSTQARFGDAEAARQALVRAARERTQLGALLVSDTVLVVQPSQDGAWWLWTVMPLIESIERWLAGADGLTQLATLAAAVARAVGVSARLGVDLAPSLAAFGAQNNHVRYRGTIAPSSDREHAGARLLYGVTRELAELEEDVDAFAATLEMELARQVEMQQLAALARYRPAAESQSDAVVVRAVERAIVACTPPSDARARAPRAPQPDEGRTGPEAA